MTTLAKLIITPEEESGIPAIPVLFNPHTYSITKTVQWGAATGGNRAAVQTERGKNAPALEFGDGVRAAGFGRGRHAPGLRGL